MQLRQQDHAPHFVSICPTFIAICRAISGATATTIRENGSRSDRTRIWSAEARSLRAREGRGGGREREKRERFSGLEISGSARS